MRLVQVLLLFVEWTAIFSTGSALLMVDARLRKETFIMEESLRRDEFVRDGFLAMCSTVNEVDETKKDGWYVKSVEWKNLCLTMWSLEEMNLEITREGYRQVWSADGRTMAVDFKK